MVSGRSDITMIWLVVLVSAQVGALNLLGGGEGPGSCPAPPFRGKKLNWPAGCPLSTPCCSEYGYCVTEAAWLSATVRDCNGLSNGASLPEEVIRLEAFYAAIEKGVINDPTSAISQLAGDRNPSSEVTSTTTTTTTEDPTVVRVLVDDDILKDADVLDIIAGQGGGQLCGEV